MLIKWLKTDEQTYQSCGSVIKSCKMKQRKSTNGTNAYGKRKRDKYFELSWFLKDICNVINYFPEFDQSLGKEDIPFPL